MSEIAKFVMIYTTYPSLAEADEAFVGMEAHPDQIGKLAEPKRFERSDLHGMPVCPLR